MILYNVYFKTRLIRKDKLYMRMRLKPWARPELAESEICIQVPKDHRGKWRALFGNDKPLCIELGCGKGGFMAQLAPENTDCNFIAVDAISNMLGLANRNIKKAYAERNLPLDNVRVLIHNVERISEIFAPEDRVERIYINFCNPWPRSKHHKRRLTHPRQLEQYKQFLVDGGEIRFKTDSDYLFKSSVGYFRDCGFEITYITEDLHNSDFEGNIETEHEKMFTEEGITTKFLIAKYNRKA